MCGIVGFLHKKHIAEADLIRMNRSIEYRGPDDEGYFLENIGDAYQLGLGHKRLSILDLSSAGHQPMFSDDGNIIIVYNGEIYNFKEIRDDLIQKGYSFFSETDTEVIIKSYQQWGIGCLNKFNGMFAFALYDKVKQELYLARDRIGIKPLYYHTENGDLVFSSELKPLMEYPGFKKTIDFNALNMYLFHGYITAPLSIFEKTYKLEPGKYLKFKDGKISCEDYWSLGDKFRNRNVQVKSEKEYIQELDDLLSSSVQYRMISDVPLGAFLSGGIDSSTVVAIMQKLSGNKTKTFTIGFHEKSYNEATYAKEVANILGTEHQELYVSIEETKNLIRSIPDFYDEPFADSSQLPTFLVSKLAREKVTVSLSGDGGDELFCGYTSYNTDLRYSRYKPLAKALHSINALLPIEKILAGINRKLIKLPYLYKDENIINFGYLYSSYYLDFLVKNSPYQIDQKYFGLMELTENIQEKHMLLDMNTYLPDDILAKVDRASMAVSLEARVPILDHRVIEFALSLPHQMKVKDGVYKYLLKQVLHKYVPKEIMERPKWGFGIPVLTWLHNDLYYLIETYLGEEFITKQDIFSMSKVKQLLTGFQKKDRYFHRLIWHLIVFQMWWEKYINLA